MGAIKSDGTMWVWGSTNYGILGLNVYGAGLSDSVSSPIQLGTETTWDNACFGGNNSAGCMAVKTDGSLWGWGQNRYGTLGLNDAGIPGSLPSEYQNSRSSPTQVGTDTTWKFVNYAGDDCIYGIKTNGTLWSWGGAGAGQLGQNTPGTTPSLRSSPVQVGTDTSWAFASGGRNGHAIATKTDGTLWCWGDNSKGALGLNESEVGAPTWTSPQRSSPTQVGSGTDWNYDNEGKISAGYQRVFAIKTNGTLWGWGRSHQGQLGLNEGGYKDYSSPVQIPGTNWATISNVSEVIATKTDGTLWTWGDNGEGKGMLNSDVDRSSPTQVPGTWSTGKRGIRSGGPQCALKVE
jgi:alpha-tubulin suppressor-like RCC1 family protein